MVRGRTWKGERTMNEERARVDEEAWGALREVAFGSTDRMDRLIDRRARMRGVVLP